MLQVRVMMQIVLATNVHEVGDSLSIPTVTYTLRENDKASVMPANRTPIEQVLWSNPFSPVSIHSLCQPGHYFGIPCLCVLCLLWQ